MNKLHQGYVYLIQYHIQNSNNIPRMDQDQGTTQEPKIIKLDVFFIYGNTSYQRMLADQNSSLKSLIQRCYEYLASLTDQNIKVKQIQIKEKKYDETDERSLKELGIENKEKIYLYIINRGNPKAGNMNQDFQYPQIIDQESLINNYSNVLFSNLDGGQRMQSFKLEQEILLQCFSNNDQHLNLKDNEKFKFNKYHVINNSFRRYFDQNKKSNNLIDPLTDIYQQAIVQGQQQLNQDFLIFVLANQLKEKGQLVYQTKKDDILNILSLQASFGFGMDETTCLQFKITNVNVINFLQLNDPHYFNEFQSNIKKDLAEQLGIPLEDINLLQIEDGSIKVYFMITNAAGVIEKIECDANINSINKICKKYKDAELVLHNYFQEIHLSHHDFDPKYNIEWRLNHKEYELRGPKNDQIKYFFPRGWKGYALNVKGKYNRGNDDWLRMDGNENEWHIMFHGTQQVWVKDIIEQGLNPGPRQKYRNKKDLRKGEIIGSGVYFSNHIEVCEKYSKSIQIGGFGYKVVFMSRVNPSKLKQIEKPSEIKEKQGNPDWDNDYFVVNSPEDIRPYRILLKKGKI